MFGQTWFNGTIRRYVIYFGTIFSDVWLQRDDSSGTNLQTFKVPLNYGPKEKYLARLEGNPNLDNKVALQLPRMSFEMINFNYDSIRKLNTMGRSSVGITDGSVSYQYNPVPYNIGFQLSIMVKNAEDGTRIIEQILPFFTPDFTATLNLSPETNSKFDVPIVLDDVSQVDTYEGNFETRRALIWTLSFTMKGWLFGPVRSGSLIKHIDLNLNIPPSGISVDSANSVNTPNQSSIAIYAGLDANGSPISWEGSANSASHPTNYINPYLVNKEDDYGFIVDFSGDT